MEKQIKILLPGLESVAEYQPKTVDTVLGVKAGIVQLDWTVKIKNEGQSMSIDYYQGIGNIPDFNARNKSLDYDNYLKNVLATGNYKPHNVSRTKPLPVPSTIGIVWCLVMDASVLQYSNFEDWSSEYGYDPDSRNAEKIYQLCLKQSLAFKNLVGGEPVVEQLQTILQDY